MNMEYMSKKLTVSFFLIPSLVIMSEVIGSKVLGEIKSFSETYSKTLFKHLTSETEIQLINGILTKKSEQVMQ